MALRKTALYRRHLGGLSERVQRRFLQEVRTPLMACLGASEAVEEAGVRYTLPEGRGAAFVRFREGTFEVAEGREHLPHPSSAAAPKRPKAAAYAHD